MYPFSNLYPTTKKSYGINTDSYIVLHHTGGGTYESNCHRLSGDTVGGDANPVSVHFVVWPDGRCAKIGQPMDIMRHAGESTRGTLDWMNSYSMWIEIVWPDKAGGFPNPQYDRVVDLVKYLIKTFWIPIENILCHHDITRAGSRDKKLRDWVSPARKPDVNRALWAARGFTSFDQRRHKVFA